MAPEPALNAAAARAGRSLLKLGAVSFALGLLEAVALRAQLAHAGATLLPPGFHYQLLTLHGTSMVFLALVPVSMGLFLVLVPARLGARGTPFPALSRWGARLWWAGAVVLHAGLVMGGTSAAGMLGNASLTSLAWAPRSTLVSGVDGWAIALLLVGVAASCVALDIVATVLVRRPAGMKLADAPPFAMNSLLAGGLGLLAFPALALACATLLADRWLGTSFHALENGADPTLWPRLTALLGHPQISMLLLPAMGAATEIVVAAAGRPLHGRSLVRASALAVAGAGALAWLAQFTPAGATAARAALPFAGTLLALAASLGVAHWIATLWGRRLDQTPALLFTLGMAALLMLGAWSMLPIALQPASVRQVGTLFTVAHAHEMLFGGAAFGLVAALYQHWPALGERTIDARLGAWHFWLWVVGVLVTFVPMHALGLAGMPRRVHTYPAGMGWGGMNAVASSGALILAAGAIVFAVALQYSRARAGRLE